MATSPEVQAPFYEPDEAVKQAIAERHGVHGEWVPLGPRGEIHAVYRVGEAVVRIPRNDPDCICDTLTEIVALQALAETDFPTPRLLGFDAACDLLPVPYCITTYFDGRAHPDQTASGEVLQALGDAIARLHVEVTEVPDPQGWLDEVGNEEPWLWLDACAREETISTDEIAWARALLESLGHRLEADMRTVFVHNDVHELNILSRETEVQLIDWGDAGWGDPSFDLCVLPAHWVADVLDAYERHLPVPDGMRGRIAWNQIGKALRRLGGPERRRLYGRRRLDGLRRDIERILG